MLSKIIDEMNLSESELNYINSEKQDIEKTVNALWQIIVDSSSYLSSMRVIRCLWHTILCGLHMQKHTIHNKHMLL